MKNTMEKACRLCLNSDSLSENTTIIASWKSTVSTLFPKLFTCLYKSSHCIENFILCERCQEKLQDFEAFIESCCDCDEENTEIDKNHITNCRLCHRQFFSCERRISLDGSDCFVFVTNVRKRLNSDPVTSDYVCKRCSEICHEMYEFQEFCLEKQQSLENSNDTSANWGLGDIKEETESDQQNEDEYSDLDDDDDDEASVKQEIESVTESLNDLNDELNYMLEPQVEEQQEIETNTNGSISRKRKKSKAQHRPIKRHITAESDIEYDFKISEEYLHQAKESPLISQNAVETGVLRNGFHSSSESKRKQKTTETYQNESITSDDREDFHIGDSDTNREFSESSITSENHTVRHCQVVVEKLPEDVLKTVKTRVTTISDESEKKCGSPLRKLLLKNSKLPLKKRVSFNMKIQFQEENEKGPLTRGRQSSSKTESVNVKGSEELRHNSADLNDKEKREPYEQKLSRKEKIFHCHSCSFVSKTKHSIKVHMLYTHMEGELYKCIFCTFKTKTENSLKQHVKKRHDLKSATTNNIVSAVEIKGPDKINKEVDSVSNELYECNLCKFKSNQEFDFMEHMAYEHRKREETFTCKHCPFRTTRKTAFKRHASIHSESVTFFNCNKCNFSAKTQELLSKHQNQEHPEHEKGIEENSTEHEGNLKENFNEQEGNTRGNLTKEDEERGTGTHKSNEPCNNKDSQGYKCRFCNFSTSTKYHLNTHVRRIHLVIEDSFTCDQCPFVGKFLLDLKTHMKDKHPKTRLLDCRFCTYKAQNRSKLVHHETTKHPDNQKRYQCAFCDFQTRHLKAFTTHVMAKHLDEAPVYRCEKCDYSTKRKNLYEQHLVVKHDANAKMFSCDRCDFITRYEANLNIHIKHKHDTSVEEFQCELCTYKTTYKQSLQMHMKNIHLENIVWFHCDQCSYKTKQKKYLKHHIEAKHSRKGERKQYKCFHCSHRTFNKYNLNRHMKQMHVGPEMVFSCEHCKYKSRWKISLVRHMKVRHGEAKEVYKCLLCDYSSKRNDCIRQHLRNKHKQMKVEDNKVLWKLETLD